MHSGNQQGHAWGPSYNKTGDLEPTRQSVEGKKGFVVMMCGWGEVDDLCFRKKKISLWELFLDTKRIVKLLLLPECVSVNIHRASVCLYAAVMCVMRRSRSWFAAAECQHVDSTRTLQVKLLPDETQTFFFPACIHLSRAHTRTCRQACAWTVSRSVGHKEAVHNGKAKPETPQVINAAARD